MLTSYWWGWVHIDQIGIRPDVVTIVYVGSLAKVVSFDLIYAGVNDTLLSIRFLTYCSNESKSEVSVLTNDSNY
jgi:hypothetical protein